LVRRELEEVGVLDLRDRPFEVAATAQLLEDLLEGVVVLAALEVVLVGDALVAVQHLVLPVAAEETDQEGLEVQAGGAVESLVEDDADLLEVPLLLGLEMLSHSSVGT